MSTVRVTSPASKNGICIYPGSFDVGEYKAFWVNAAVSDSTRIRVTLFKDRLLGEARHGKDLRKVLGISPLGQQSQQVPNCFINPQTLNLARKVGMTLPVQEAKIKVVTQDTDSVTIDVDLTEPSVKKAWDKAFYSIAPGATPRIEKASEMPQAVIQETSVKVSELTRVGSITLSAKVTLSELKRMFGDRSHITITDANNNMMNVDLTS